jgi:hypothetical protein
MPSTVVLTAVGLNIQPNALSLPDGSLSEASNIIIRRDNVIEPRRGFALDGDTFGDASSRLKQLFDYKKTLLRHYANVLQFENGINNDGSRHFSNFSGSYIEPQSGTRIKSIQSNGNFYFTTSDGIKKISAISPSQLSTSSGYVTQAGGVKAIDLTATLNIQQGNQTGFLPQDSTVAYRSVWGITDANNNLILGTPSQRAEVFCPLTSLLIGDFDNVLGALDNIASGSMIDDGDYTDTLLLGASASASELAANTLSLAAKIDNDIVYANSGSAPLTISGASITGGVCAVTFSSGDPTQYWQTGSKIYLVAFGTTPVDAINGPQVITTLNSTTITFNTTATGAVTVGAASIVSSEYRNITTTAGTNQPSSLAALTMSSPATDQDIVVVQDAIDRMISRLIAEPTTVIPTPLSTEYIVDLDITTTATVKLSINIPQDVTSNHFLQVYRSTTSQATGTTVLTDLTASDEMQLVYEAFPTAAELAAHVMTFEDITPDSFLGAYLYTNESTGEGALAANDIPPWATDINLFKNVVFYANTKTRQRKLLSLLGVSQMIEDAQNSITPSLVVSTATTTNTYTFVLGVNQISSIDTVADVANSLNGKYFLINSANDATQFYVWYKTSGGSTSDPAVAGKTGIRVDIDTGDTDVDVAKKTANALSRNVLNFVADNSGTNTITIDNIDDGETTPIAVGTSGFANPTTVQAGAGENIANKQVLLSTDVSPAKAVDLTARSLVRVINTNQNESIYVYYLSGAQSVPGSMDFESRSLSSTAFYLLANDSNTGSSFNPDLSPTLTITSITSGTPATNLITTSTSHGLLEGDQVVISGTTTTPVVDGLYTISYVSPTTFRINETITVGDAISPVGKAIRAVDAEFSSDEVKPNRIYYSKLSEPEAVPIVNYFDVGSSDKAIIRIFPLRDSLFVFKEDGLFRISGETAPFTTALFDSSYNLIVADSLALSNNTIYGWTTQGISSVSESGATPAISRPIDVDILKLQTSQYTNFKSSTFGLGYESDNSYLIWTVSNVSDTVATICYRYSTTTNTWTTYDKTNTCGIVNSANDRLYLGAGDMNSMEQERKNFDRYDYADREYSTSLASGNYAGNKLKFANVSNMNVGDVLVQEQTLTVYDYNMLLKMLDGDQGVHDTDYYSTLKAVGGDDMRAKLLALATKLDNDSGVAETDYAASIADHSGSITSLSIASPTVVTTSAPHGLITSRYINIVGTGTTPSTLGNFYITKTGNSTFTIPVDVQVGSTGGTYVTNSNSFQDLMSCYNIIIDKLNLDSSIALSNYTTIEEATTQEAIITAVDANSKTITLNLALDWVVGAMTIFAAIESQIIYAPQTMQDPLGIKHLREATVMFENKAFTKAVLSFSTDLLPSYISVPFNGDGNGIFGFSKFGGGFFGGGSNAAPFRTYVPRNCQRCRFIQLKFNHRIARENYSIFGMTLTGEISQSSRGYR